MTIAIEELSMTVLVTGCADGSTLVAYGDIPDLIAQLQEVANLPSIPALQAQLARVQEMCVARGVECDRLTNEVGVLRKELEYMSASKDRLVKENEARPIHDTDCYVGKRSLEWWAQQDRAREPVPTPVRTDERIANALERIADRLEDHLFVTTDKA